MNNLYAAIYAHGAAIYDPTIELTGTVDSPPRRFVAIEMIISANYDDEAMMEKSSGLPDAVARFPTHSGNHSN